MELSNIQINQIGLSKDNYSIKEKVDLDFVGENKDFVVSKDEIKKFFDQQSDLQIDDNTVLEFSIHEKTKDVLVKIVNRDTGEVVKEIPSEKIVDLIAFMCEKAGLIVDKKI